MNSSSATTPERSVPRYVELADAIQARIASGEFPAGSQLPPEREIARQNGVAYLTARQAMGLLVKKGIVSRRHGHGTFVRANIPKDLIGLFCGPDLRKERTYFYRAMVSAVERAGERENFTFRSYDALTDDCGEPVSEDSPVRRSMSEDLANYNFSGTIEIAPGRKGVGQFSKDVPAPRVIFEPGHPLNDLDFDYLAFGKTAVHHLVGRGVRKILILRFMQSIESSAALLEGAFDAVAEAGDPQLQVRVADLLIDQNDWEKSVYTAFQELVRKWKSPGGTVPGGLVVGDDIAMRSVSLGLIQSGLSSLPVICQACETINHHYGMPVSRYEFQLENAAAALIGLLKAQMKGSPLPSLPLRVSGVLRQDVI